MITNNLKIPLQLARGYLGRGKSMLSVSFLITSKCNFRCKYCDSYNQNDAEMTTGQIKGMLDELAAMNVKRIGFTGGEPLLRQDIGEVLDHAKGKGMKTTLFSNGALVPRMIDKLKSLDLLLLSFDGPKEVQDRQRMENAYESVVNAVNAAKKAKIKIWTNTVLTKDNIGHVEFILDKVKLWGAAAMFMPVFEYSITADKKTIESMSSELAVFRDAIGKLVKLKKDGYPIINSESYFKYLLAHWPEKHFTGCYAGRFFCAINSDGTVAPCHYLIKSGSWPNGLRIGFANAVEKARLQQCSGCYGNAYVDSNLFFSLNLETIYNAVRMYRF